MKIFYCAFLEKTNTKHGVISHRNLSLCHIFVCLPFYELVSMDLTTFTSSKVNSILQGKCVKKVINEIWL